MAKHNWDFDDAVSVSEFYKDNGVKAKDAEYLIKDCTSEEGESFKALGLTNGETLKDGRAGMTFFCLSSKLEAAGHELNDDFLAKHKDDIMLLEPVDGLKFGVIFLAGSGGKKKWSDL